MTNTPYRKIYDENGVLTNPITKMYPSKVHPNRRERKYEMKNKRFTNNRKTCAMTVLHPQRWYRVVQYIGGKRIEHYLEKSTHNARKNK